MTWGAVAGAAVGVVGGMMKDDGGQQTQKQELDPRMQAILYGNGSSPGMLTDIDALRKQQMAQGGLNDMQRAGMEMQRQTLMSPQYTHGFDQMRSMGSQLMGGGVAGNPFANGGNGNIGGGIMAGIGGQSQWGPGGGNGGGIQSGGWMPGQSGQNGLGVQPFQYNQNGISGAYGGIGAAPQVSAPAMVTARERSPLDDFLQSLYDEKQAWIKNDGPGTRNDRGGAKD